MPSLPQGYAAADDDPWRGASPFGIAVTMGATRRRWVTGRSPVDGATAALLARRWARCCHSTLLSIVDCGVADDGTPWFAVPEVEPAGDVSLEELLEVIEAVGQLHADGQNHGALAEALVRDADGRVRVSPPWMGEGGSDHEALADALARAVTGASLPPEATELELAHEAPQVVGEVIAGLREGRVLVVDAVVALRECTTLAEAGTSLPLTPLRPAVALVPADPPPSLDCPPAGSAALRARAVRERPSDADAVARVWGELRDVAASGRPRGVVVQAEASELSGWASWLTRVVEGWGLARTLTLRGGDDRSLVWAMHPGGTTPDEVESRWRRMAGATQPEQHALGRRVRRWCGALGDDERRSPAAVGRWELQRRIDAAAGRGLFVLTIVAPVAEGWALAADIVRGDAPVLVVLLTDAEASEADDAFVRVTADAPVDLAERLADDEVLEPFLGEATSSARAWLQRLEARADGAPADGPLVDGQEALARQSGVPHRVRDALHLAALAEAPTGVLEGFLGPARGLWAATRLADTIGGAVSVDGAIVAEAQARPDRAYLHRRLSRAWARDPRSGAARSVARHAAAAGELAEAVQWLEAAADEARGARQGAVLKELATLLEELAPERGQVAALWRARGVSLCGEDAAPAWEAAASHAGDDPAVASEIAVGRARCAVAQAAEDAEAVARAAADQAAAAGAPGLEGEALVLAARVVDQGDNDAAAGLFAKGLHRLSRGQRPWCAAEALIHQAAGRARRGELTEAQELYEDAAEAFLEVDDGPAAVRARLGAALCLVQVDDLDAAMAISNQAQSDARAWLDPRGGVQAAAMRARVERHAGTVDAARSRYERVVRDAAALGLHEVLVDAHIGRSLLALAQGDQHLAYECTTAAAAALEALPDHPLWAKYRLAVAAQLAQRADHMQTWQWLWSANELGLEHAERDIAEMANLIAKVAQEQGWGNVIRVAGKVAVRQLRRLGSASDAERLKTEITGFISR